MGWIEVYADDPPTPEDVALAREVATTRRLPPGIAGEVLREWAWATLTEDRRRRKMTLIGGDTA